MKYLLASVVKETWAASHICGVYYESSETHMHCWFTSAEAQTWEGCICTTFVVDVRFALEKGVSLL